MTKLAKNLTIAMSKSDKYNTQEELANALGVSQTAIHKVLTGETKQPRYILEMANLLNVSADWLKTGEGSHFTYAPATEAGVAEEKTSYSKDAGAELTEEQRAFLDILANIPPEDRAKYQTLGRAFAKQTEKASEE